MALKTTVNVSTTYIIPAANIDMVFTRFTISYLQQIYFQTKFYQNYETYVNTFEIMTFVFFISCAQDSVLLQRYYQKCCGLFHLSVNHEVL